MSQKLQSWLNKEEHQWVLALFAGIAAFSTYSCMYAFRKPFTAGQFLNEPAMLGLGFKSALVIFQIFGYMLSKFAGIKFISEMKGEKRAVTILGLISISQLAWVGFGFSQSSSLSLLLLFINGVPLGLIWGLVFSYLEGRRFTEIMGIILCASFIFSSGLVKDIARKLMEAGVSEFWMPAATGAVFYIPLLVSLWLLSQVPAPNDRDIAMRTKREPMKGSERRRFFKTFGPGLVLMIAAYVLLTAYRSFRDDFMADIWAGIRGPENIPDFSATETPLSIVVLVILMGLVLFKNNYRAFMVNQYFIIGGLIMAGLSTYAFTQGWINDMWWMGMTGFGTYIAYIPYNTILFDRLIATFKYVSNVGFLIYVADSFGYLGSITVLIYKDILQADLNHAEFFIQASYALMIVGGAAALLAMLYFARRYKKLG